MHVRAGLSRLLRVLVLLVATSGLVRADDMRIDFFGPGDMAPLHATTAQRAAYNGTVTYAGGVAPLVGSNINISAIISTATPLNEAILFDVTGTQAMTGMGTLNFTTGDYAGMMSGYRQFAGGGSFEIWGALRTSEPVSATGACSRLWSTTSAPSS